MEPTIINTYKDLHRWCKAYVRGGWPCLILLGSPGLGKTTVLKSLLPPFPAPPKPEEGTLPGLDCQVWDPQEGLKEPHARWLTSHVSAFEMYQNLFIYKDQIVIFDDVDGMYDDRLAVKLLKAACNTEKVKTLAWHTANKDLLRHGIPKEFQTRSRTVIIANDWKSLDKNVGALEDRAMILKFVPSAAEVHREVGGWFKDEEILAFFKDNLDRIHAPSFRHYVNAKDLKKGKIDWRGWLESRFAPPDDYKLVGDLLANKMYVYEGDRINQFIQRSGRSRAHYFRIKKELVERNQANTGPAPKLKIRSA